MTTDQCTLGEAPSCSIEQQVAAVLHDVIEDCDVPHDFLAERFPAEACDLVRCLTKVPGEDYEAFSSEWPAPQAPC